MYRQLTLPSQKRADLKYFLNDLEIVWKQENKLKKKVKNKNMKEKDKVRQTITKQHLLRWFD